MRIVSLCPSLTETVADLGRGDALVGCTKFCVHPQGLVAELPKVGGTKDPRIERILELNPDLVLMNEEENRREDAETLGAAGIECHVSFPKRVEHVPALVRDLGEVLGATAKAEQWCEALGAELALQPTVAANPSCVYLIWRKPWMAVNGDTFISDLLVRGGWSNGLDGEPERYPTLEAADLCSLAPDRVLLSSEPFPFAQKHLDELVQATGWDTSRFEFVDGERLSWHGTRCLAGLRYARELAMGAAPQG